MRGTLAGSRHRPDVGHRRGGAARLVARGLGGASPRTRRERRHTAGAGCISQAMAPYTTCTGCHLASQPCHNCPVRTRVGGTASEGKDGKRGVDASLRHATHRHTRTRAARSRSTTTKRWASASGSTRWRTFTAAPSSWRVVSQPLDVEIIWVLSPSSNTGQRRTHKYCLLTFEK